MTRIEFEEKILSKRNFNKKTLDLLWNATQDTIKKFGKIISEEEIVSRIINNLRKNIIDKKEIIDRDVQSSGRYNLNEKTLWMLKKLPKEYYDKVFLHEFLHCISSGERYSGFATEFGGAGLNEGITEYLTQKIRPMDVKSYGILVEIIEALTTIIPEEKIISAYFNDPLELFDELEEKRDQF